MEGISSRDAYDACARVIGQTTGATQVRVEVCFSCVELEAGQHALPYKTRIAGLPVQVRQGRGNRRKGSTNHWQGTDSRDYVAVCRVPALGEPDGNERGRSTVMWRERKALSQQELAEKAGITRAALSRIESAQAEPHPRNVRKLARALGLEPEDLMDTLP